ncbi:MAG TPA: Holliday junction resolvase RuvX [Candidatus Saccharibacteria bacterium]|nr:Holliday junction resolvase RuvX [Candidatus Saccharibacteria bacterium]
MPANKTLLGLDVGKKYTGVALADTGVRIAVPFDTVDMSDDPAKAIGEIIVAERIDTVVVGYPRNQSGLATTQTTYVENFTRQLEAFDVPIEFQDESLTSVMAEERLKAHGRPYSKQDIDAQAAAIILQDFIEVHYG